MLWMDPMKIFTCTLLVFVVHNVCTQAQCISKTAKEFENNCYELISTTLPWTEAQEHCMRFSGKRSLAKVASHSVLSFLHSLKPSGIREVWLGANDELQEGKWVWTDGTIANLTSMWNNDEPNNSNRNEHCLEMNGIGKLNDLNCSSEISFICMEVHETSQKFETTTSTTKRNPATTKMTPSTTKMTPSTTGSHESNDKFMQLTLVAFTVGLSKPLDVLLKDVVVYNKVVSNIGDDYNNSTGVFRCNMAGLYFFQIHGAAGKGKELSLSLVKNKKKVISLYSSTNQELSLAANSAVLLLEAGDEVFVEASNCGNLYGEEHHVINTFSGFLLGASIVNA